MSEQPVEAKEIVLPAKEVEIKETDKPFILAIMSLVAMVVAVMYCLYLGQWFEAYQAMWKDVALLFLPLVTMAWAWYFKSKSD